jgi:hypothetical protein
LEQSVGVPCFMSFDLIESSGIQVSAWLQEGWSHKKKLQEGWPAVPHLKTYLGARFYLRDGDNATPMRWSSKLLGLVWMRPWSLFAWLRCCLCLACVPFGWSLDQASGWPARQPNLNAWPSNSCLA